MIEGTWTPHRKKSLLDPRTKLLLIFVEAVLVLATAGGERLFWFRVADIDLTVRIVREQGID
jgi:hypothetical protein